MNLMQFHVSRAFYAFYSNFKFLHSTSEHIINLAFIYPKVTREFIDFVQRNCSFPITNVNSPVEILKQHIQNGKRQSTRTVFKLANPITLQYDSNRIFAESRNNS